MGTIRDWVVGLPTFDAWFIANPQVSPMTAARFNMERGSTVHAFHFTPSPSKRDTARQRRGKR